MEERGAVSPLVCPSPVDADGGSVFASCSSRRRCSSYVASSMLARLPAAGTGCLASSPRCPIYSQGKGRGSVPETIVMHATLSLALGCSGRDPRTRAVAGELDWAPRRGSSLRFGGRIACVPPEKKEVEHYKIGGAVAAASQRQQQPPGCRRRCGNVTVPYPFGIGAGCHRGSAAGGFRVRCDDDARRPPRLTVSGYGHEVAAISLPAAEATVFLNASRACYDRPGRRVRVPLLVDEEQVRVRRCPGLAYFTDDDGYYVTGCMSVCRPSERTLPGSCRGDDGCCQSNIPLGLASYRPHLGSFRGQETTFLANSTACAYAFMVDAWWFWFAGSHFNRTGDFAVPVVLDWAIRDAPSCAAAQRDPDNYACRSAHSVCLESANGRVPGQPLHVDECQHRDEFPCYGTCVNTPGSFICTCPKGSSGNATIQDGCRPDNKFSSALKAVIGTSAGVFFLLLACFSAHLWLQKRRLLQAKRRFFEQNGGLLLQQQLGSLASAGVEFKIFSEEEIGRATGGFAEARVLGRGGHGVVYRGVLADGSAVAVKKSRVVDAKQVKEFAREMLILSQINHCNVVKLLGCCLEVEVPVLVYEYVPNGSLHGHIHGDGESELLPPGARLRIAAESADALAYMHSSASPPVLHRDVKSANILLDAYLAAKVSDFGASRLAPAGEAAVATLVQGTLGYLDPEYLLTSQLTSKSDVYSFAVAGRHREVMDRWVREELGVEVLDEAAELAMRCLSMVAEGGRP
ncbi:wall-associated receptor kinase 3-like [Panicum miliaceum]|uniref:Wall-associated receptor kinase 3-like n=1 Tax=Panicum miliaceum TaxID=4540 RepID=A0A3L6STC5_PANMI|nr:wall-associated receptor kinase 3-like [Panicum miliaceum]